MSWEKWKHAFAIGNDQQRPLTPVQEELIDRLCKLIIRRQMTPAAVAFIELSRPLNYLGAQGMLFLEPLATAIFSPQEYRAFAEFLERRDAVDILSDRLIPAESSQNDSDSLSLTNLESSETETLDVSEKKP